MGHDQTEKRGQARRARSRSWAPALLALALLAFAAPAQAAPKHPHKEALDVSGLNHACGAAVDSKGDFYASSAGESKIKVYDPSHTLLTEISDSNTPCGLAVTTTGNLYVSERSTGEVVRFEPDKYPFEGTPTYGEREVIDNSGNARGISIDPTDDRLYVAEGDHVSVYHPSHEVQSVSINNATGGSFKLKFEGEETASLPFNASAAEVQAALGALSSIGAGNVSVSGSGSFSITFTGALAAIDVPQIEVLPSLSGNETQTLTVKASGGSFRLKFEGQETAPIPYNASAAELKAALVALSNLEAADLSVTGGPGDEAGTNPYLITFEGAYAGKDVGQLVLNTSSLTGTLSVLSGGGGAQTLTVKASAGTYRLIPTTATGTGSLTNESKEVTGVSATYGTFQVGDAISGSGIPAGTTIAAVGAGTLELSAAATQTGSRSFSAAETTAAIPYNASAAELKAALVALAGIEAADISVSGGPGDAAGSNPYLVVFEGAFAGKSVEQMAFDSPSTLSGSAAVATGSGALKALTVKATAGTFKLKFEGEETAPIPYNASAAEVKAALVGLATIEAADVSVSGGPGGPEATTRPYLLHFEGAFAGKVVKALSADSTGLSGTASVQDISNGPSSSASTSSSGGPEGANEVQSVSISGATGGTFKLKFEGQETASLPFNASAAEVQAALEALSKIGAGNVSVSGSGTFSISFSGALAHTDVPQLELLSSLSGNETQKVTVVASAGTYKLKFQGEETAAIPHNATAAELKAALVALGAFEAADLSVSGETGGANPYKVTFEGAYANKAVAQLNSDVSALTGTASVTTTASGLSVSASATTQGSGQIGEGPLSEASGVAAYSYTAYGKTERYLWVADANGGEPDSLDLFRGTEPANLKLRRELDGSDTPDGSFGFGAAGAYLAEDPGNRGTTGKCAVVGEEACTSGHLYLYDAEHNVLDEFDGSGDFFGQTTNAAFGDAEPTAIAIDRSGTSTDGTLYVTAGAGSGAKALAFGPLKAPSRKALAEPLSHTLVGAVAVATDSHGYVYAVQSSLVHVYKPDGTEIKNGEGKNLLTDAHKPWDIAVDSTGKIYVMDGGKGFTEEFMVTYYTPNEYPPKSSTTYTRHEPPIAVPKDFPAPVDQSIRSLAVIPGPGPGKDRVLVGSGGVNRYVHLYDSAANGSTLLNSEFGRSVLPSTPGSIAANGSNGTLYFGINPHLITALNEAGTEVLAQFENTGPPSGKIGFNPVVAVDQASGHVVEFDGDTSQVLEYDAAGGFVTGFGNFTEGLVRDHDITVDNACALQEPPLTGEACEEFDPANGTVYVAFDDPNPEHPPYDITAFGPLTYPQVGEAPTVMSGKPDGFGPGSATLRGTVNPHEAQLEECVFEYLTDAEYRANVEEHPEDEEAAFEGAVAEECAESTEEIGAGNEAVDVHAEISGLDPEAPYRFRLVAKNSGGLSHGAAVLFGPPLISPKNALPVLYKEATLRAEISPSGLETEYRFDFLDRQSFEEQGESFEGPATHHTPMHELTPGEDPVAVSAALTGLEEGTEYLFRAVAGNDDAMVKGPTRTFTTQARRAAEDCPNAVYRFGLSAKLPDCRAYELVTPAQTDGLDPRAEGSATSPSRDVSNWLAVQRGEAAGERLSYFTDGTLPGFEGNGIIDGYRAERGPGEHPAGGWQSTLFSPSYIQGIGPQLGVSSDQLYSVWEVNSEPQPFPEALPKGLYLSTPTGFEALARGSLGTDPHPLTRHVGPGGAHAIFSSTAHLESSAPPEGTAALYDRAAGSSTATVVSSPPPGASPALKATFETQNAEYLGANEAGTAVAFSVGGSLYLHREGVTFATGGGGGFNGISEDGKRVFSGLSVCDTQTGPCAGEGAHPPIQIAPTGTVVLVSPDGSHVFFSSAEAIGEEVNENGEEPEEGSQNLYAWDGSQTRFIGRLSAADFAQNAFGKSGETSLANWTPPSAVGNGVGRAKAPTRSTPNGDVFVFQSHAPLTAYDNEGRGEIYRYDPAAEAGGRLVCVSCDPSGAPPSEDAALEDTGGYIGVTPVQITTMIANVTDDGQHVFFQSFDRLLPEDANEVEDVYEWTAKGAGEPECTRAGGCLALISSGQGETPSFLYAMSADGRDVFINTHERLVGADIVGSPSIYDARIGGGIPEPVEPIPCQGDACQGSGTEAPVLPSAGTTGTGEGNEITLPCPKGKRRVGSRCTGPKHKHRRHKRHHHRGHKRGGRR